MKVTIVTKRDIDLETINVSAIEGVISKEDRQLIANKMGALLIGPNMLHARGYDEGVKLVSFREVEVNSLQEIINEC